LSLLIFIYIILTFYQKKSQVDWSYLALIINLGDGFLKLFVDSFVFHDKFFA